jgi:hypothetical protein
MFGPVYNPRDWYWLVADGPEDHVWSSRRKAYVPGDDADYGTFVALGRRATRIGSEAELATVLGEQFPEGSPRPPRHMAPLAFRRLFTDAERLAIHTAAQANAAVAVWVMDGAAAQVINLDDPATIAALDALVAAGLLTAARRDAILG